MYAKFHDGDILTAVLSSANSFQTVSWGINIRKTKVFPQTVMGFGYISSSGEVIPSHILQQERRFKPCGAAENGV